MAIKIIQTSRGGNTRKGVRILTGKQNSSSGIRVQRKVEQAFSLQGIETLVVCLAGKSGELFYLTGCLPEFRKKYPGIRVVLRTCEHYGVVERQAENRFDAVELFSVPKGKRLDEYVAGVAGQTQAVLKAGTVLEVNAYRKHLWNAKTGSPFYRCFTEAIGSPKWILPSWKAEHMVDKRYALALPTTNKHSSKSGRVGFKTETWAELADRWKDKGLVPVYTRHHQDAKEDLMPGWESVSGDLSVALDLVRQAAVVVGPNSGMTFVACADPSTRVFMADDQTVGAAHYRLSSMKELNPTGRIFQLQSATSLDVAVLEFAR